MKRMLPLLLLVVAGFVCLAVNASSRSLQRSSPERQGISSSAILAFVEAVDQEIDTMNSFMLLRHGHVVAEGWWSPYDAKSPHCEALPLRDAVLHHIRFSIQWRATPVRFGIQCRVWPHETAATGWPGAINQVVGTSE
jgi:hypothetical protein